MKHSHQLNYKKFLVILSLLYFLRSFHFHKKKCSEIQALNFPGESEVLISPSPPPRPRAQAGNFFSAIEVVSKHRLNLNEFFIKRRRHYVILQMFFPSSRGGKTPPPLKKKVSTQFHTISFSVKNVGF